MSEKSLIPSNRDLERVLQQTGLDRRSFLKTSTLAVPLLGCMSLPSCRPEPSRDRPNLLWLDAEDLSPDLGCYGNPLVRTPHLDRLAAEGLRYTSAFTSSPVCSPSRSAIMTGMYQTSIGAHNHRSHREDGYKLPSGVRLVTDYFRQAGYFTCRGEASNLERPGKLDYNFTMSFEQAFDGTDWRQRQPGQPFFAHVHFSETHRDFYADSDHPIDPAVVELPPCYPDHPITRLDWALYLETVQNLDKKVGRILERLDEDGLLDNTIVMFTGDHGRPMVWGKQWLYEGGIRVPLIVWAPGRLESGVVNEELVSAIDWAPTWMALAGIAIPEGVQGRAFLGDRSKQRDFIFAARDRCDETVDRIRCVRDSRFKYIRNFYPERPYTQFNAYKKLQYPVLTLMQILHERGELEPAQERFFAATRPVEELYDLREDPYEVQNLAGNPSHEETLVRLRTELDDWICRTRDQGQTPEDPEVAAAWNEEAFELYYARDMRRRGLDPNISPEDYLRWWEEELRMRKGV